MYSTASPDYIAQRCAGSTRRRLYYVRVHAAPHARTPPVRTLSAPVALYTILFLRSFLYLYHTTRVFMKKIVVFLCAGLRPSRPWGAALSLREKNYKLSSPVVLQLQRDVRHTVR